MDDQVWVRLISAAREGDPEACNILIAQYRPALLAQFRGWLPPHLGADLAEDLVQEVCFDTFRKLRQFLGTDQRSFWAWLRQAARCDLLDAMKSGKWLPQGTGSAVERVAGRAEAPSKVARRQEKEAHLHAAMNTALTLQERTAVHLRYLEKLSVRETAERMGCHEGTVRNRCVDAKRKLRAALGRSSDFFSSR